MPAIVYQTNKRTGVTYAYESVSHWDKDKRQSRARRKCIGRVDPETKEITPTRKELNQEPRRSPDEAPFRSQGSPGVFTAPPTSSIRSGRIPA